MAVNAVHRMVNRLQKTLLNCMFQVALLHEQGWTVHMPVRQHAEGRTWSSVRRSPCCNGGSWDGQASRIHSRSGKVMRCAMGASGREPQLQGWCQRQRSQSVLRCCQLPTQQLVASKELHSSDECVAVDTG
jgi:hypothetical protein